MNSFRLLALFIFTSATCLPQQEDTYVYKQELEAFKNNPDYKNIFNEELNPLIRQIYCDIENYQELSGWQRFFHNFAGTIVITPKTMPKLYAYIDSICKQGDLQKKPTAFINTDDGLLNAFAIKILKNAGAIVIGQKLINSASDTALESIIAHEIGHIKCNHVNKGLALSAINFITLATAFYYCFKPVTMARGFLTAYASITMASLATSMMIGKTFERQADRFAYKQVKKGEGLQKFFQLLVEKEDQEDKDWIAVGEAVEKSKNVLKPEDLTEVTSNYSSAKFLHKIDKFYSWLYHNTPYGPHPSPQERIKTIQNYLDTQQTQEA